MQFIRIKDFEKLQHYRDRKPPWIKLYRDLLADDRLFDLSEADRFQLVALFILASQHDNMIPNKPAWLRSELRINRSIQLQRLIDTGWVELVEQDASGMLAASDVLAERKHLPIVETEKRRDREETETYIAHGEFGLCLLTVEQYGKLQTKLGIRVTAYIDRFDRWLEENPKLQKTRKAYPSILNWADRDEQHNSGKGNGNGNGKYRETEHEKNNRAIQAAIDRSMATEVLGDLPNVWEDAK
jgi:hypothetical protein